LPAPINPIRVIGRSSAKLFGVAVASIATGLYTATRFRAKENREIYSGTFMSRLIKIIVAGALLFGALYFLQSRVSGQAQKHVEKAVSPDALR
jgi:hypothetical protein